MNNKGFTVVELIMAIALTLTVVYGAIVIPTQMMRDYSEYNELVQETSDLNKIKKALSKDLEGVIVKELNFNTLQIGKSVYRFNQDGLYRESNGNNIKLSEQGVYYSIENKILNIYNDSMDLKYSIGNSSFETRGDNVE